MTVFRRGKTWWYEFQFRGQRIRESSHTSNKTLAGEIQRKRREKLAESAGGVRREKPVLFANAAKAWLAGLAHIGESTREIYTLKLEHLKPAFGKMLLCDISISDIAHFQRLRQKAGASGREINMETAVLRMILRKHKLWHLLEAEFKPLRERQEVGRALNPDEIHRLLIAAKYSRSRSLHPALILLLNTGMRVSEVRHLKWSQVDVMDRSAMVGESETEGGKGRVIPLNQEAYEAVMRWRSNFENPLPEHYVFPSERYGFNGHNSHKTGAVAVWNSAPTTPMGSWKVAWSACRKAADVKCRLHDLRHTFVSRLGEKRVADSTLTALSGWMSLKMLERYSHTRNEAKRNAVELLSEPEIRGEYPQNPPQPENLKIESIQ